AAAVACFYLSTFMFGLSGAEEGALAYRWIGPLLLIVGVGAALFTRSRNAARRWAVFAIGWALTGYFERERDIILAGMIAVGIALMLADAFVHETLQRLTRFARPLAAYGLLIALLALVIMQTNRLFSGNGEQFGLDRDV